MFMCLLVLFIFFANSVMIYYIMCMVTGLTVMVFVYVHDYSFVFCLNILCGKMLSDLYGRTMHVF